MLRLSALTTALQDLVQLQQHTRKILVKVDPNLTSVDGLVFSLLGLTPEDKRGIGCKLVAIDTTIIDLINSIANEIENMTTHSLVRYPSCTYELQVDGDDDSSNKKCIASAIVTEYNDREFFIHSFAVREEYRGKGYGRELMDILLKQHQQRDVALALKPEAYEPQGLDDSQLEAWYLRLGFEWDENHEFMVKHPHQPPQTKQAISVALSDREGHERPS